MKRILKIFILLFATVLSYAQVNQFSTDVNYIYSKNCLNEDCSKKTEVIEYLDELGRSKQIINIKGSPSGKDIVTPIEYDGFGRNLKSYLPIPQNQTQNGAVYENPHINASQTYGQDSYYYSSTMVESSPIGKIVSSTKPGSDYQSHNITYAYEVNAASEVKKYTVQTTWENGATKDVISESSYYTAGQLVKNSVKDEDGLTTTQFLNGKGQIIMVRKEASPNSDTYYVYNKYNQLIAVIPPLASAQSLNGTTIDKLCYQYKYDSKGRVVEKKLPGKGWEYMVYDRADRLVLTQDASLEQKSQWLLTKYDLFGRVAYTAIILGGGRSNMQSQANSNLIVESRNTGGFTQDGMHIQYTNNYFHILEKVLTVNYYDTYPSLPPDISIPVQVLGKNVLVSTKTLPTATYTKNIENDSWTKNFILYDTKERSIGVYSFNHLGGYTKTETEIDFSGITQRSVTKHKRLAADTERIITETFEYDTQNRVLVHKHQVDSNPVEILSQNSYDELSRLTNKKVGGTSAAVPLESIDYTYNIRGWLTKINDPKNLNSKLFGYELKYNQVEGLETPNLDFPDQKVKPKYNGNIAEVDWKTNTTAGDHLRRYGYVYDDLNRLTAGFYQKDNNPSGKEYFERIEYDLNGNITHLKRSANAYLGTAYKIDDLTYEYLGNRLTSVTDSSLDYGGYPDTSGNTITYYEESGSIKSHKDKGILDIKYNYLDLPSRIIFDKTYLPRFGIEGTFNVNTQYLYRADGVKLRKVYIFGSGKANIETYTTTEYLDGFQYEITNGGGKPNQSMPLKFVPTSEGYYNFENNKYIYNYTDHLGNIRLSYFKNANGSAEVLEENNYYPFGLKHEGYNILAGNPSYKYGYNGQELQTETGWNDYGFRNYMPDIGRFGVVDPLADTTLEPYSYASNNPAFFIDFLGLKSIPPSDGAGYSVGQIWTDGTSWWQREAEGWKNTKTEERIIDDIILKGGASSFMKEILDVILNWGNKVDNMLTQAFFGFNSLKSFNNYQRNLSRYDAAVKNSKGAQEVEAFEEFLFLELPASFAGEGLIVAGWRAANLSRFVCRPLNTLSKGLIKICFTEGTLVAIEKGNKKIEDIKEGDFVWSYNEETGKKELKKVVALSRNTSSSLVKISINGTEITCTPEHPFYVNGNWIEAKDLTKGMLLTTLDGKISPVEAVKFLDEKVKVYNFEVEGNHNYYVSEKGILVHNDCGVSKIIEAMPSSLKQMFQCKQFAASLMERMTAQGMKGEMVTLKSQTRYIWSNTFNRTITETGEHVGVKVGNTMYDNLYPQGIEYSKWLMDLEVGSPVLPPPTITPF